MRFRNVPLLLFLFIVPFLFSCANYKKAINFYGIKDSTVVRASDDFEPIIRNNDLLSIDVTSLNQEATSVFNVPNYGSSTAASAHASGYLVDKMGNVQFPFLGKIKAAGLTTSKLKEEMASKFISQKLLVDPIITIRYLNFKVTVLGEVNTPKVIDVEDEKISIPEALGRAGDMTIYARRDNVVLLRDENGNRVARRLNLNSEEVLSSPYYFLKTGDILYVEPNKAKVAGSTKSAQLLPVIFSALSFAAIAFDRLTR